MEIPNTRPDAPDIDALDRPPSRLWQLPFFLIGLGIFLFVYLKHPTRPVDTLAHKFDKNLLSIRSLLTRSATEVATALNLAEAAQQEVVNFPQSAGEVAFLLGSAHARKAELTIDPKNPPDPVKVREAREHWEQARQQLDRAVNLGVADADRPRLQYRLARALFMLEETPERIVQLLTGVVDKADDPVEGYQMLIQTLLHTPHPDLKAALEANEKLRNIISIPDEAAAYARLQAGEIQLQLGQPEEAHKVLRLIGNSAPPKVQVRARALQVRSYMDQSKWDQAASLLVKARSDPREPPENLGRIHLDLGYCYFRLQQPDEAAQVWEQCLKLPQGNQRPGPEQRAAAVQLAELHLQHSSAPDKALDTLEGTFSTVPAPEEWSNELVEQSRVTELCERAIQSTAKGQRDLAIRWTQFYQKVAPPGRAQQLRGELLAQAGQEQWETASRAESASAPALKEQATKVLREAARSYAAAADLNPDSNAQATLLWKAAELALQVQDSEPATQWLTRLLKLVDSKDVVIDEKLQIRGKAWYLMAETLRQMNSPRAEEAYEKCIGTLGPWPYRARFQLAMYAQKRGAIDDAEAILEQNLHLVSFEPDDKAKEWSLYAIGGLYFQQKKYQDVARNLEKALDQFPKNPDAPRARLQLAESYRQLALQNSLKDLTNMSSTPEGREHYKREHRKWLTKAAEEFENLARFITTQESEGHLTKEERLQVPFTVASCRFDLGQYDKALEIYAFLAEEHRGTVASLEALGGAVRCHAALGQNDLLQRRLGEIRSQLPLLPDEAMRGQWEQWLTLAATKPAPAPEPARSMSPRQQPPQNGQQRQPGSVLPGLVPGQSQPTPGQIPALGPERISPIVPPG
jgi:tetratricopeptide (TPR) repeat protein